MNKKREISNTQTNSNRKRFQKVTPISILEKTNPLSTGDYYFTHESLIEKGFLDFEKSISRYNQTVTGLQLEYIQFCESFFKLFLLFQKSVIGKAEIETVQFEETAETNSKVFENLLKINVLKFESFILSLESFTDVVREWNSLFLSNSNTFQKIFSYKNN